MNLRSLSKSAMILAVVAGWVGGCNRMPKGGVTSEEYRKTGNLQIVSTLPYLIRTGDTIQIRLFTHPDLADKVPVQPDGRIALQLIGEVEVAGKTVSEARELITEKYKGELKNPSVSVSVVEFAKQRVYIGGEVRNPGAFNYETDATCLRAVTEAGGFSREADPSFVVILRNQGTRQPQFIVVDLKKDVSEAISTDIPLVPQDIVFVPMSGISKLNKFVEQYITKMIPAQLSVGVYYDLANSSK